MQPNTIRLERQHRHSITASRQTGQARLSRPKAQASSTGPFTVTADGTVLHSTGHRACQTSEPQPTAAGPQRRPELTGWEPTTSSPEDR
jgi:hypothetical protein